MKLAARGNRWALSFADLCLLLLGFFVLLQARPDSRQLAAGLHEALGVHATQRFQQPARILFEPGEAILRPAAGSMLAPFVQRDKRITVVSRGTDPATNRFDAWELAAARAAAIARALGQAGVAQDRITIDLAPGNSKGQVIALAVE